MIDYDIHTKIKNLAKLPCLQVPQTDNDWMGCQIWQKSEGQHGQRHGSGYYSGRIFSM